MQFCPDNLQIKLAGANYCLTQFAVQRIIKLTQIQNGTFMEFYSPKGEMPHVHLAT